jgi:hypothetical protein
MLMPDFGLHQFQYRTELFELLACLMNPLFRGDVWLSVEQREHIIDSFARYTPDTGSYTLCMFQILRPAVVGSPTDVIGRADA